MPKRSFTSSLLFLSAFAAFALPRSAAAQTRGDLSVKDVTSCPATIVEVARTPLTVRRQEQIPASNFVVTLDGVFDGVPVGSTFHVTHVTGTFFSEGNQVFHVRLYQNGSIVWTANVDGPTFHSPNSSINVKTLNQPTDLYFASDSLGEYDLQIVRSSTTGIATGIVQFWGYLTASTCGSPS